MRKVVVMFVLAIAGLCAAGDGKKGEVEEKVPLDQLPQAVKSAAEGAVKGIVLTEAEKETKNGVIVYEIDGKAGDKEYEIKVSADGKVLKVKEEKPDDDEDEDDNKGAKNQKKAVPPPAPPKGDF